MSALPKTPGHHKADIGLCKTELFDLTKSAMLKNPKLYQFSSIEDFVNDLSIKYPCEIYICNDANSNLVGFFGHYDLFSNENELLIIVVHPDFQNQGYGKKMMEFYFNLIKGKSKSVLSTHENNAGAIKFYQSLGYKIVKKLPDQYGDGQTRVLFEKYLF